MFGVPLNTLPLVMCIGLLVIGYYYIASCHSEQLPVGLNYAFWWYGPLSEDQENF